MKLTKQMGGEITLSADGLAVEEDPPGQCKVTYLATGLCWNVQETVEEVNALIAADLGAKP